MIYFNLSKRKTLLFLIIVPELFSPYHCEEHCYKDSQCDIEPGISNRFLLYDVNPPEGFNLRRDVYMRFALLAHKLKNTAGLENFRLVLPPWSHLVHWRRRREPEHVPWGLYFDLPSLQAFAPVIEIHEFFRGYPPGKPVVLDKVYILQHFPDMFETGNFEDRMQIGECAKEYPLNYFFYSNLTSNSIECLNYHGAATKLDAVLLNSTAKAVLIHHAEVALHDMFGDRLYWRARRSMRFSKSLRQLAAEFRRQVLNSSDVEDGTVLPENWMDEKVKLHRKARGGPYLAVHWRRKDFLWGRSDQVPSLEHTVEQIAATLKKLELTTVFVATDASDDDFQAIESRLGPKFKVLKYIPPDEVYAKYKDGGVAIVDQIICSHARYFIGTSESTFSFRIQEEREILGFKTETTFNAFCRDEDTCKKPSVWKIVH